MNTVSLVVLETLYAILSSTLVGKFLPLPSLGPYLSSFGGEDNKVAGVTEGIRQSILLDLRRAGTHSHP